jgi:hypothetical protein
MVTHAQCWCQKWWFCSYSCHTGFKYIKPFDNIIVMVDMNKGEMWFWKIPLAWSYDHTTPSFHMSVAEVILNTLYLDRTSVKLISNI